MNKYILAFCMSVSSTLIMSMGLDEAVSALDKQRMEKISQRNDFKMKLLSTSQKKETVSKIVVAGKPAPEIIEKKQKRILPKVRGVGYLAHSADFDIQEQACSVPVRAYSDSWLLKQEK